MPQEYSHLRNCFEVGKERRDTIVQGLIPFLWKSEIVFHMNENECDLRASMEILKRQWEAKWLQLLNSLALPLVSWCRRGKPPCLIRSMWISIWDSLLMCTQKWKPDVSDQNDTRKRPAHPAPEPWPVLSFPCQATASVHIFPPRLRRQLSWALFLGRICLEVSF